MKVLIIFSFLSLLFGAIIASPKNEQGAIDITNRCPYEGRECPNAQRYTRDYQVELETDSITVYDGDKVIGSVPYTGSAVDSLFLKDNL